MSANSTSDSTHSNQQSIPSETDMLTTSGSATTNFVDTGLTTTSNLSTNVDSGLIVSQFETIKDFLAKPQLVSPAYSIWNTDTALLPTTTLDSYNVNTELVTAWTEKLKGFGYWRGTVHIRVTINAQPFQAGRLLLHFLPNVASRDASFEAMHNAHLVTKAQQPSVELDCTMTSAELAIPYISPNDAITISSGDPQFGVFYLSVLMPLRVGTTSATSVPYAVYMWFTDVELYAPLLPQSGTGASSRVATKVISHEEALKIVESRAVSTGLSMSSKVLDSLSGVPLLSSFCKPAAWVADSAAKVAYTLGFAKPDNISQMIPVHRSIDKYSATGSGQTNAFPLSLTHNNAISLTDRFALNDADEMSFEFLKKTEVPYRFCSWTSTTLAANDETPSAGGPLTFLMNPGLFSIDGQTIKTSVTVNWRVGHPIWYLSKLFALWRGGVNIRFSFAKTPFHTGRLELTYIPHSTGSTVPDLTTSTLAFREIIDLSLGTDFSFKIPYMLPVDWLYMSEYSGKLYLRVLTPLRAPDTCDSTINFLTYVSALDDFEFAAPNGCIASSQYNTGRAVPFSPQTGIGNSAVMPDSLHIAERSVGERFTSIRQLLSRMSPICYKSNPFTAGDGTNLCIWPWFSSVTSASTTAVVSGNSGGDVFSYFSPMYAYYRGSMNVRNTNNLSTVSNTTLGVNTGSNTAFLGPNMFGVAQAPITVGVTNFSTNAWVGNVDWSLSSISLPGIGTTWSDSNTGPPTWHVPYYCARKLSYTTQAYNAATDIIPNTPDTPITSLQLTAYAGFKYVSLSRAIGEDFQFTYFLGCPPLIVSYV